MTKRARTAPKSKAAQLAELFGIQLLPWQETVLNAHLAGKRLVIARARQGGTRTVRALADLADALRTPPAQAAPMYTVLDEAFTHAADYSLPLMLTPHDSPDPRMYHDYVWAEGDDLGSLGGWENTGITAACGAVLDTYNQYEAGHVPACSICSAQPLVPEVQP